MNDNDNTNFFVFTKADRIAIISIISIVAVVIVISYLCPLVLSKKAKNENINIDSLLMIQGVALVEENNRNRAEDVERVTRLTPVNFNPNEMNDDDWLQIGLSKQQIRTINNYIAKGGQFKVKSDFANLYCISDEEYAVLEPYIQLPDKKTPTHAQTNKKNGNVGKKNNFRQTTRHEKSRDEKLTPHIIDINTADSAEMMTLPKMNAYLASRIVRYRNDIGSFVDIEQLTEIKGIDASMLQSILPYLMINQVEVHKIKINTDGFKSLLKHPYLNYDQVKAIVRHREKKGFITEWEQLVAVLGETGEINQFLKNYVEY